MNGPGEHKAARQEAWDRYWRSGTLHSCPGSYSGNYSGALGDFWKSWFASFEPGHRVLDLASGNGPLPALLLDTLGDAAPAIDAVDYARPRPGWLSERPGAVERIRFHGGVAMESLPFADASFDRVISQYGFEYADTDAACAEVIRVAKPDSGIAMVCHHPGSRPAQVAAEEADLIGWLLEASPLVDAARGLLPWIAMSATEAGRERLRASPEANAARQAFNDAMGGLVERARTATAGDVLADAHDMFRYLMEYTTRHGEQAGAAALTAWLEDLADARVRARELTEFALDEAAIRGIADRLEAAGFEARVGELHEDRHLMGWTLVANREIESGD